MIMADLLTFDFLLQMWTHNKPDNQSCDKGRTQRNAQCTPPWHFVEPKHCAHKTGTTTILLCNETCILEAEPRQKRKCPV